MQTAWEKYLLKIKLPFCNLCSNSVCTYCRMKLMLRHYLCLCSNLVANNFTVGASNLRWIFYSEFLFNSNILLIILILMLNNAHAGANISGLIIYSKHEPCNWLFGVLYIAFVVLWFSRIKVNLFSHLLYIIEMQESICDRCYRSNSRWALELDLPHQFLWFPVLTYIFCSLTLLFIHCTYDQSVSVF